MLSRPVPAGEQGRPGEGGRVGAAVRSGWRAGDFARRQDAGKSRRNFLFDGSHTSTPDTKAAVRAKYSRAPDQIEAFIPAPGMQDITSTDVPDVEIQREPSKFL